MGFFKLFNIVILLYQWASLHLKNRLGRFPSSSYKDLLGQHFSCYAAKTFSFFWQSNQDIFSRMCVLPPPFKDNYQDMVTLVYVYVAALSKTLPELSLITFITPQTHLQFLKERKNYGGRSFVRSCRERPSTAGLYHC